MENHIIIEPLSSLWLQMILITAFSIVLVIILGQFASPSDRKILEKAMGIAFLGCAILIHPYLIATGNWHVEDSLPLHACHLTGILSGVVMFWRNQKVYEILIYWGIPGAFHSLLTPELPHGLNGIYLLEYYLSHGGIILAALYLTLVCGMKPARGSWKSMILWSQIVLPVIGLANWLSGGNYMYLAEKPMADNPFIMGDWPWYILMLEVMMLLHFLLMYLPFHLRYYRKAVFQQNSPEVIRKPQSNQS
ncbi:MAG: TIGR02206 family membrane protein [Bacteroidia bacterium]|nr:TIGR02206 family membrane protein [Bacteroidia bacterium]